MKSLELDHDKYGNAFYRNEEGEFVEWLDRRENPAGPDERDGASTGLATFRAKNPNSDMADATETVKETGNEALALLQSNAAYIILGDAIGGQVIKLTEGQLNNMNAPSWLTKTGKVATPLLAGGAEKVFFPNSDLANGLAIGHAVASIKTGLGEVVSAMTSEEEESSENGGETNGEEGETQNGDMSGLKDPTTDMDMAIQASPRSESTQQLSASYSSTRNTATSRDTGTSQRAMMEGT